jgi:diguanylate cyclase (GGDEF)-like protein/PAS domain S-box-containing protein
LSNSFVFRKASRFFPLGKYLQAERLHTGRCLILYAAQSLLARCANAMTTRSKIFFTYTLFLFLPLFAAVAIGAYLTDQNLKTRLEQEARYRAASVRSVVEAAAKASFNRTLHVLAAKNLDIITSLYQKSQTGALTPDEAKWLAGETLTAQSVGHTGYIFAYDSHGIIQSHPQKKLVQTRLADSILKPLQQAPASGVFEFQGTAQDGKRAQSMACYKVSFAPWNWTIAVVCSTEEQRRMFPLPAITGALEASHVETGLHPFLLYGSGTFWPPPPTAAASTADQQNALRELVDTLRKQENGQITGWYPATTPHSLEKKTYFFHSLPAYDLIVGVSAASEALYAPLASWRQRYLVALLAFALLSPITIWLLSHRLAAPLGRFAKDIAATDVQAINELHIDRGYDELVAIAAQFNRLLSGFRHKQQQVETEKNVNDQALQLLHQEIASRKGTQQKLLAEIATRKSAENYLLLFKNIFDNAIEGIFITDPEARILTVNTSFSMITGYQPSEVIGNNPSMLSSGRQSKEFYRQMWQSLQARGSWSGEIWNRKKDGTIWPQWLSISEIKNEQHITTHYFAFFHDISELKRKEKQISIMAYSDALTRLPNRAALERQMAKAISRAARDQLTLAVFFIDLDNFKNINDSLGHDQGDLVLIEIAERLLHTIRSEDTLSRLGGDEFILLSENIENTHAIFNLASRLLASLKTPILLGQSTIYMHASIGIAVYPEDGQTIQELIKNADMAMYKAKSEGKNKFVMFTREMNEQLLNRIRTESSLRNGLMEKEFIVFYQPKIDLISEQPTSFEALIRWQKDGTLIGPDDFIPIAEESGLIDEMSLYVLNEVCIFLSKLQQQNLQVLPVSVNISPRTFHNLKIVESIDTLLEKHRIDHTLLEFEITETTAMKDVQHTLAIMHRFRQRGIRFSIDDFGTGYSSLSYLSEMPVSTLKIDKRFISAGDANCRSIVSTITAMSKQMELKVIAEGVETNQQLQWLRGIGCNEVQGFYFSRPMPEQDTLQYLRSCGTPAARSAAVADTTRIKI